MKKYYLTIFCSTLLLAGCSFLESKQRPAFSLTIPPAFNYHAETKSYKTGDYILKSEFYELKAKFPIEEAYGSWGVPTREQSTSHTWSIEVSLRDPAKILRAYENAKDGYEADVDENNNYMFARFEKKVFPWGKGFSYFTQFSQDPGNYVPHNGHLTYEVWGVTNDLKHVIHARCEVTHPKLASWGPEVRTTRSNEELKNDRDYKLVESCSTADFSPPLDDLDKLIGSVRLK